MAEEDNVEKDLRVPPEVYDYAMSVVTEQIDTVRNEITTKVDDIRSDVMDIKDDLKMINGSVTHHERLLWGDPNEPDEARQPGVVQTVRELKDLGDKAITVLNAAKWVFGFIGVSLLLMFAGNLLETIQTIVGAS